MNRRCEPSYNKNYINASSRRKISDVVTFDPEKFARWLTDAFESSSYKSWEQVARKTGTTRSTLSRYAGAKRQLLTGKPSQPQPELVVRLAELFRSDVDQALVLAGHAPRSPLLVGDDFTRALLEAVQGASEWSAELREAFLAQVRNLVKLLAAAENYGMGRAAAAAAAAAAAPSGGGRAGDDEVTRDGRELRPYRLPIKGVVNGSERFLPPPTQEGATEKTAIQEEREANSNGGIGGDRNKGHRRRSGSK